MLTRATLVPLRDRRQCGYAHSHYGGEYGQPIHLQSCLNLLLFVKLSRSPHIHWFGATNAERFTIIADNDAIAKGLADGLGVGQIQFRMNLSAVRKAPDGRIVLTFGQTERTHDAVVLAIPATVIRDRVALHSNLGIAPQTRSAIGRLQYGDNTKTMYQFTSDRPFATQLGGDGTSFTTDPALLNLQVTFPSKTGAGDPARPVIVDYSFGTRGRNQQSINPNAPRARLLAGPGSEGGADAALFPRFTYATHFALCILPSGIK